MDRRDPNSYRTGKGRRRNVAVALALVAFVAIVYVVAIVRMQGG